MYVLMFWRHTYIHTYIFSLIKNNHSKANLHQEYCFYQPFFWVKTPPAMKLCFEMKLCYWWWLWKENFPILTKKFKTNSIFLIVIFQTKGQPTVQYSVSNWKGWQCAKLWWFTILFPHCGHLFFCWSCKTGELTKQLTRLYK